MTRDPNRDPGAKFKMAPDNVMTFADFMYKEGLIKVRPSSWKDMFFPEVYDLPGSLEDPTSRLPKFAMRTLQRPPRNHPAVAPRTLALWPFCTSARPRAHGK
jgi:hypothetical protein